MKHLVIISHTEHYYKYDKELVGLGSTVTEINQLLHFFEKITHIAVLHDKVAPHSAMPYCSSRIKFVPLPPTGGLRFKDKLSIVLNAPSVLSVVRRALIDADCFQFRAPTGIGLYVIPYLTYFTNKKGWFKYAGNWKQEHAPWSYRLQKYFLKQQKRSVTINGKWPNQPKHCISFNNPCLTQAEYDLGKIVRKEKEFSSGLIELCFVGRLENEKGLDLFLKALLKLEESYIKKIKCIHIVGDGKMAVKYRSLTLNNPLKVIFHGALGREEVHDIYRKAHALVLPSRSEGFPKVISEGMNYGCIPIVTDLPAVTDIISNEINGFIVKPLNVNRLTVVVQQYLCLTRTDYRQMICISDSLLETFTYDYYGKKLMNLNALS